MSTPDAVSTALSATDLLARARRHGLELTASDADLDGSGLDYLVLHARDGAGDRWVVRAPRRPEVFAASHVEAAALALLGPRLPVAVPRWQVHAPDLIAYRRLTGTPAITFAPEGTPIWNVIDPAAPSEVFVDSFAAALAALQAIDQTAASAAGIPIKPLAEVRASYARSMDEVRATLAPSERVWARWQRWLQADALWPAHLALVHGDLHPGHTLLDDSGRLTGILDWSEAAFTDPSIDLAMFCGCFGRPALARLLARFEALGGRVWPGVADQAAERWAAFPVLAAAWGLQTGNPAVLAHARAQLAAVEQEGASV